MWRFLSGLLLWAALYGCSLTTTTIKTKGEEIVFRNADKEQIALIQKALSVLEPKVSELVDIIEINDDQTHYRSEKIIGAFGAAHCEFFMNGKAKICIRSKFLYPGIIWHEAAHVFQYSQYRRLESKWLAITKFKYKVFYDDNDSNFPRSGILTAYGATDWSEDFAEWFKLVHENNEYLWCHIRDKDDPRYVQKLNIFFEEGVINKKIYEKILDCLKKNNPR